MEQPLQKLLVSIDDILSQLSRAALSRYAQLQTELPTTNVAIDKAYQTRFNGFYRVQRRSKEWYRCFFAILEREKRNAELAFGDILEEVYCNTGRVEPSFCSKLVATVRPDKPVYDRHVRDNLSLLIPRPSEPATGRLRKFCQTYEVLDTHMTELTRSNVFCELRTRFDGRFPVYGHFTDIKKLGLLLWQYRQTR